MRAGLQEFPSLDPVFSDSRTKEDLHVIFGGLQRTSLIDYPGEVSCVLFFSGCNFNCPYCHNPGLVRPSPLPASSLDEDDFFAFLDRRRGLLDGVVLSGGEPTLRPELPSVCERIQRMGYRVKLDTNGSRPQMLRELLRGGLVDYVALDVKTGPACYGLLAGQDFDPQRISASTQLILESGRPHEFRTTCVKPLIDERTVREICEMIEGAALYALQRFNPKEVLHPAFFRGARPEFDPDELDGLRSLAQSFVQRCIIR